MSDERDPRDPALDATWRAHSTETPPAALDRTILAAAHRAAGSAPRSASPAATRPWRWWMPLAAAATIGAIAIGVLQTLPPRPDETRTVASDMPAAREEAAPAMPLSAPAQRPLAPRESSAGERNATAPAPEQSAPAAARPAPAAASRPRPATQPAAPPRPLKPEAPREDAGAGRSADDASAQRAERAPEPFPARKEESARDAIVAAPVAPGAMGEPADVPAAVRPPTVAAAAPRPPYDPASAPTADRQRSATSLGDRAAPSFGDRAATAGAAGRSVAGGSPLGKSIVGAEPAPPREPDAWIARIRALHAAGELEEAARELAAFRAAYRDADARLPASLRAWAATVRP